MEHSFTQFYWNGTGFSSFFFVLVVIQATDMTDTETLKWRLWRAKEASASVAVAPAAGAGVDAQLLRPNGRTLTVDVQHVVRCLRRAGTDAGVDAEPRRGVGAASRFRPGVDLETARRTPWPLALRTKYHGIESVFVISFILPNFTGF